MRKIYNSEIQSPCRTTITYPPLSQIEAQKKHYKTKANNHSILPKTTQNQHNKALNPEPSNILSSTVNFDFETKTKSLARHF
ncbi:hypothetical protein SAMN05660841_01850 [Sphingobacterium nematocida]|uniref:Uncharacterized protein n=1 Tax=Sphingobacterium nematocida TaxID=1513896 RepID=A0A1T5D925_9SPHI|nr:hypothetical protein SAMN05660841_01850 [Sphingobacterium nematocida]